MTENTPSWSDGSAVLPNGLRSWMETHFEIVCFIMAGDMTDGIIAELYEGGGIGTMYDLAFSLTEEWESMHQGRQWDGEWSDELQEWLKDRLA